MLGSDGVELGTVERVLVSPNGQNARLALLKGTLHVPDEAISSVTQDEVRLKMRAIEVSSEAWAEPPRDYTPSDSFTIPPDRLGAGGMTVTRHEERLVPEKSWREYGSLRIHKEVVEEPETFEVEVRREEYDVERVPVEREWQPGDERPRIEGETIIVPVVEERLEVVRRRVVTEEVHLTRRIVAEPRTITETVRKERIEVSEPEDEEGELMPS